MGNAATIEHRPQTGGEEKANGQVVRVRPVSDSQRVRARTEEGPRTIESKGKGSPKLVRDNEVPISPTPSPPPDPKPTAVETPPVRVLSREPKTPEPRTEPEPRKASELKKEPETPNAEPTVPPTTTATPAATNETLSNNAKRQLTNEEIVQENAETTDAVVMNHYKTFEQQLAAIPKVARALQHHSSVNTPEAAALANFLNRYVSRMYGEKYPVWVAALTKCNVASRIHAIWPLFQNPDFLGVNDPTWTKNNNNYRTFRALWRLAWNSSDCSVDFVKTLVFGQHIQINLDIMKRSDFDPKQLNKDPTRCWVIKATEGILHNCVRQNSFLARRYARRANIIDVLKPYLESDVKFIRMLTSIILGYIVNEDEMKLIEAKDDIISMILNQILKRALASPDRRSMGFSVEETVDALNALAKHDINKQRMVNDGACQLYMVIIKSPANVVELLQATTAIWQLTFIPKGVECVKLQTGYKQVFLDLTKHDNSKIAKAAAGTLLNLNALNKKPIVKPNNDGMGSKKHGSTSPKPANVAHVMISYNHQQKEIAHKINASLKSSGYVTWLDAEQMHGSTLDAMAAAVENSAVVLLCWSERYQDSINCRAEAELAFKLGKPMVPVRVENYKPTGWLNMILGSKYYVSCHSAQDVDSKMSEITKQLGQLGRADANAGQMPGAVTNGQTAEPKPMSVKRSGKPLEEWSVDEVQKWLATNGLAHIGGNLGKFDGALMSQFRTMHRSTPNVFYENARNFLGITDLTDLLKLVNKLETV